MPIQELDINNFPNGIIDTIESKDIPEGAASKSLNWMTLGDRIELRRGQYVKGTESTAAGSITGLHTAYRADGIAVVFRKNGRKLEYWVSGTSIDWIETGTNMFPAAASSDQATFATYTSLAGNQMFVSSPNSGLYKIMVANPASFTDVSDSTQNYSGKFRMKISQNRMFAWGRPSDQTVVYLSWIDTANYSTDYENLTTGDGATTLFTGTISIKASQPSATFLAVQVAAATSALKTITAITKAAHAQVTATGHGFSVGDFLIIYGIVGMTQLNERIVQVYSVVDANNFTLTIDSTAFSVYTSGGSAGKAEVFNDDYSGNLASTTGTGTVNYTTGAISVTFATAPVNTSHIVVNCQYELSNAGGIADFKQITPRLAGYPDIKRQDEEGGKLQFPFSYNGHELMNDN